MKYEKPIVVNLGARARAAGQDPLSCMSGNAPMGGSRICGAGASPAYVAGCQTGNATGDCSSGMAASFTCLSGPAPDLGEECEAGVGGSQGDCTSGAAAA